MTVGSRGTSKPTGEDGSSMSVPSEAEGLSGRDTLFVHSLLTRREFEMAVGSESNPHG